MLAHRIHPEQSLLLLTPSSHCTARETEAQLTATRALIHSFIHSCPSHIFVDADICREQCFGYSNRAGSRKDRPQTVGTEELKNHGRGWSGWRESNGQGGWEQGRVAGPVR